MIKAIVIDKKDNVATTVGERIKKNSKVKLIGDINYNQYICSIDDIDYGHKIAICSIKHGEDIVKYGIIIGKATRNIDIGEHVHIHNITSLYGSKNRFKNIKRKI